MEQYRSHVRHSEFARGLAGVKLLRRRDVVKPASLASPHQVGADWSQLEMLELQHFNGKNSYFTTAHICLKMGHVY